MTPSKTAKLTGSAPVLFVRDVYAATKHYRDAMGFSFGDIFGEPPSFAILKRDNMYVMVKQIEDHKHIVPRWTVSAGLWDMYFWVDDVDALYKEFVERGAKIDYGLCDQPYGCRRGSLDADRAGNVSPRARVCAQARTERSLRADHLAATLSDW